MVPISLGACCFYFKVYYSIGKVYSIYRQGIFNKLINKNLIGLYTNEDLAILKNTSNPEAEKLKKKFQKLFKEKDLDIIVQYNLKTTNYLDITLNLNDGSYHL